MAFSLYKQAPDEVKLLREKLQLDFVGGYLFWGEEEYLKLHYTTELREKIRQEGMAEFNLVMVEMEKGETISDIERALETPPVFASHKMVEVTGLKLLELTREEEKQLIEAVDKRAPDTVLVLFFYNDDINLSSKKNRARKIVQELEKRLMLVQFPRQSKEKLRSWTDRIFTSSSVHISDVLIERMIELCDFSMMRLRSESEKLICRAKAQNVNTITREWVDESVRPSAEKQLWDLTDAILRRSRARAFEIFENIAAQNFDPVEIVASITRAHASFQLLYSAANQGIGYFDAFRQAGYSSEKQAKVLVTLVRGRTAAGLARAVKKCYECDCLIKRFSQGEIPAIQSLIAELVSEECR